MALTLGCTVDVDGQSPGGDGASGGSGVSRGPDGSGSGDPEDDDGPEDDDDDPGEASASGGSSSGSDDDSADTTGAPGSDDDDDDEDDDDDDDAGSTGEPSATTGAGSDDGAASTSGGPGEVDLDDPDYGCGELCAVAAPCDPKIASIATCTASCIADWDEWPLDDPACDDAHVIRNYCVGGLDCAGYNAWFDNPAAFPCSDEDQAFYNLCIDPLT